MYNIFMFVINSLIKLSLGLVVLLVPLYFDLRLSDVFGLSKTIILYFFSIIILYLIFIRAIFYKEIPFKKTKINIFLFIFLLVNIASSIASTSQIQSIFGEYKSQEGLITLLCYCLLLFTAANFINEEKNVFVRKLSVRLSTSFVLSIILLVFFPPRPTIGFQGLDSSIGLFCFIAYFLCFFFLLSFIDTPMGFIKLFIIPGVFSALYYDLQLKGWDFIQWEGGRGGLHSTFGNSGWVAHYGMLIFFLSLALFFLTLKKEGKKRKNAPFSRYISICLVFFITIFLFISFFYIRQRSTFVGLSGGFIFFLIMLGREMLKEYKKPIFILLLICIPVFLLYSFTAGPKAGVFTSIIRDLNVVRKTEEGFGKGKSFTTVGIRFHIWKACLKIIKDYPILGCGLDTMMTVYPRYRTLKHVEAEGQYSRNQNAHNDLLQITSTTGFLGLFSYLLFNLAIFFALILGKSKDEKRILLAGLGGSWMAHHMNNLFSFGIPPINATFWVIMGLIVLVLNEKRASSKIALGWMKFPICGVISILGLLSLVFVINMYQADVLFKKAKAYEGSKRLVEAISIYKDAIRLNPFYKDYYDGLLNTHLTLARESLRSEWTKEAILFAKRSVKLFPEDSIAWNFLGGAYYMDGIASSVDNRDAAVLSYKYAVKFEPFLRDAYTNIGQIRLNQGRKEEALLWFKKVLEFAPEDLLSLYHAGYILLEQKHFKEGRQYLEKLILLYPEDERAIKAKWLLGTDF